MEKQFQEQQKKEAETREAMSHAQSAEAPAGSPVPTAPATNAQASAVAAEEHVLEQKSNADTTGVPGAHPAEQDRTQRALSSLCPTRIPTAEPYLSIEEAEERISRMEMKHRASESDLQSMGESSRMSSPLDASRPPQVPAGNEEDTGVSAISCEQCEAEQVTHYCEECQGPLCTDCASTHERMKSFRSHRLRALATQVDVSTDKESVPPINERSQAGSGIGPTQSFNMNRTLSEWDRVFQEEMVAATGFTHEATSQPAAEASLQTHSSDEHRVSKLDVPPVTEAADVPAERDRTVTETAAEPDAAPGGEKKTQDAEAVNSAAEDAADMEMEAAAPVVQEDAAIPEPRADTGIKMEDAPTEGAAPEVENGAAAQVVEPVEEASAPQVAVLDAATADAPVVGTEMGAAAPAVQEDEAISEPRADTGIKMKKHAPASEAVSEAEAESAVQEDTAVHDGSKATKNDDQDEAKQPEDTSFEPLPTSSIASVNQLFNDAQAVFEAELVPDAETVAEPANEFLPVARLIAELVEAAHQLFDGLSVQHRLSFQSVLANSPEALPSILRVFAVQAIQTSYRSHLARSRLRHQREETRTSFDEPLWQPMAEMIREAQVLLSQLPIGLQEPVRKAIASSAQPIQKALKHISALSLQCAWRCHVAKRACNAVLIAKQSNDLSKEGIPSLPGSPARSNKSQESNVSMPTSVAEIIDEGHKLLGRATDLVQKDENISNESIKDIKMKEAQEESDKKNQSAIKIQARARGARDRSRVDLMKEERTQSAVAQREHAALKIQARARGARDRSRVDLMKEERTQSAVAQREHAALKIQARARGARDRKRVSEVRARVQLYLHDPADEDHEPATNVLNFQTPENQNVLHVSENVSPQCVRPDPNESDPSMSEAEASDKETWDFDDTARQSSFAAKKQRGFKGEAKKLPSQSLKPELSTQSTPSEKETKRRCSSQQDGYATIDYENGDWYEGNIKRGVRHGHGIYKYANGDTYDGAWILGQKQGFGTYKWSLGEFYRGMWLDNKQNGKGEFEWPGGGRYEGEWGQRANAGDRFPKARPTKADKKNVNVVSLPRPGTKISYDTWRAKEQSVYRNNKKQVTGIVWAEPSRPATAMSQATTVEALSRPRTTETAVLPSLGSETLSRVQSVQTEVRNLRQMSGLNQTSDLRQKSGLSQTSTSSISKKVRDQPDLPARAQEGADDIFLQLSSAMRSTGKMTPLNSASRTPKFEQTEPWHFRASDASILRKFSSEANKSSRVYGRLLADIDAGKSINRLLGYEASFEDFPKRPREPKKVQTAIQHMIHELRDGLSTNANERGDLDYSANGPKRDESDPVVLSNNMSCESLEASPSKGKSALHQHVSRLCC